MSSIMCDEREGSLGVPAREFCVDNGSMIATLGQLQLQNTGPTKIQLSGINQSLRTDETNITWE